MNAPLKTRAEIGRALLEYVVNPKGERPSLEITTPEGTFHLVTVEGIVLPYFEGDNLTFILFFGRQPIGRAEIFMWPSEEVETPAHAITELEVYGT